MDLLSDLADTAHKKTLQRPVAIFLVHIYGKLPLLKEIFKFIKRIVDAAALVLRQESQVPVIIAAVVANEGPDLGAPLQQAGCEVAPNKSAGAGHQYVPVRPRHRLC